MPKTLRAAAAGSCRTSAVTPLSPRLSQWAFPAALVPTGLCRWPLSAGRTSWFSALAAPASALPSALVRVASNPHDCASRLELPHDLHRWPRLGWSLLGSRLCACFEFGLGGGEFGSHLLSGHGDLALVPVDGDCLALRAEAGSLDRWPKLATATHVAGTISAATRPSPGPTKATHRGGIQRPMRNDLAFGSPPAERSAMRVVPSEPGHRSRRGVYLTLSSLPPLLLLELHGPRDLNPRTGKVDNRARRQVAALGYLISPRRAKSAVRHAGMVGTAIQGKDAEASPASWKRDP
jgi:hypothetical protein